VSGRGLCRWCGLEVPEGRLAFWSEWCVHECARQLYMFCLRSSEAFHLGTAANRQNPVSPYRHRFHDWKALIHGDDLPLIHH